MIAKVRGIIRASLWFFDAELNTMQREIEGAKVTTNQRITTATLAKSVLTCLSQVVGLRPQSLSGRASIVKRTAGSNAPNTTQKMVVSVENR